MCSPLSVRQSSPSPVWRKKTQRTLVTELGWRGFTEDSKEQGTLSASQSGIGCKRSSRCCQPSTPECGSCSKTQKRKTIRETSNAELLGAEPLLERLDRMVYAAAFQETLDDNERIAANLPVKYRPCRRRRVATNRARSSCSIGRRIADVVRTGSPFHGRGW